MTEKILEKEKEQIPEQKCHRWANMNAHYIKKKKKFLYNYRNTDANQSEIIFKATRLVKI